MQFWHVAFMDRKHTKWMKQREWGHPTDTPGDNITEFSFPDDRKFCTQGIKNIISEDKDLEPQQSWEDIADGSYYSTSRF